VDAKSSLETALSRSSSKYDISSTLLLAIILVESSMNKNAIGAMPKTNRQKKMLEKYLKILGSEHKTRANKKYWSIYPKCKEEAKKILLILENFNIGYDLGLTQINVYNIKKRNINKDKLLEDEEYSIDIGAKILKECIKYNKSNVHDSIECYNKGTDKRKYTYGYSKRVLKKYEQLKKGKQKD
jgi:soluble lytic murein transglycosylase-like protein